MKVTRLIASVVVGAAVLALGFGIVTHWPQNDRTSQATDQQQAQAADQSPMISQPRPAFTMPDLQGRQRNISEWDGKVLAVNFWATWCEPCKQEIPNFNTLQKQYGGKGFQFVGVALDDLDAVQDYLKTATIDYPVLVGEDEAGKIASRYGDDEGVVPYTAFINRKGQIAFIQYGAMSPDLARQVIQSLL